MSQPRRPHHETVIVMSFVKEICCEKILNEKGSVAPVPKHHDMKEQRWATGKSMRVLDRGRGFMIRPV
jgi:hypothetical protein